jgi:hypothetical protein
VFSVAAGVAQCSGEQCSDCLFSMSHSCCTHVRCWEEAVLTPAAAAAAGPSLLRPSTAPLSCRRASTPPCTCPVAAAYGSQSTQHPAPALPRPPRMQQHWRRCGSCWQQGGWIAGCSQRLEQPLEGSSWESSQVFQCMCCKSGKCMSAPLCSMQSSHVVLVLQLYKDSLMIGGFQSMACSCVHLDSCCHHDVAAGLVCCCCHCSAGYSIRGAVCKFRLSHLW